jgi:hypothetical protein
MKFRTIALALALSCGFTVIGEAATRKQAVTRVKPRKAKAFKNKRIKPRKVQKPKVNKRRH